jgi:hypothetical protein
MLPSSSNMEHSTDTPPLTSIQQCVVDALAAGSTLTNAAETYGIHRVTVYRWMKTSKLFAEALHRARAEFVLARRDDLHHLSNRALETLLAILDNPNSSPAVLLRTAMFILQRPQLPKTGWSMPEPAPDPDGEKLLDSAIIEKEYDSLPGIHGIDRYPDPHPDESAPTQAESATSEPPPGPAATGCNTMQHDSGNSGDVAPAPSQSGLHSCPVPADVLKARNSHQNCLDILEMLQTCAPPPRRIMPDLPAEQANEDEILAPAGH